MLSMWEIQLIDSWKQLNNSMNEGMGVTVSWRRKTRFSVPASSMLLLASWLWHNNLTHLLSELEHFQKLGHNCYQPYQLVMLEPTVRGSVT